MRTPSPHFLHSGNRSRNSISPSPDPADPRPTGGVPTTRTGSSQSGSTMVGIGGATVKAFPPAAAAARRSEQEGGPGRARTPPCGMARPSGRCSPDGPAPREDPVGPGPAPGRADEVMPPGRTRARRRRRNRPEVGTRPASPPVRRLCPARLHRFRSPAPFDWRSRPIGSTGSVRPAQLADRFDQLGSTGAVGAVRFDRLRAPALLRTPAPPAPTARARLRSSVPSSPRPGRGYCSGSAGSRGSSCAGRARSEGRRPCAGSPRGRGRRRR